MNQQHVEYEHKFILTPDFDLKNFEEALHNLTPLDFYQVEVKDRYFYRPENRNFIYRHRQDSRLNQLTYKSAGADSVKRTEINLNLSPETSEDAVDHFIDTIGSFQRIAILKSVHVYYYKDVEIVYYRARQSNIEVCCVEFEVRNFENDQHAEVVLEKYEKQLGFANLKRTKESLLEIFLARAAEEGHKEQKPQVAQ